MAKKQMAEKKELTIVGILEVPSYISVRKLLTSTEMPDTIEISIKLENGS